MLEDQHERSQARRALYTHLSDSLQRLSSALLQLPRLDLVLFVSLHTTRTCPLPQWQVRLFDGKALDMEALGAVVTEDERGAFRVVHAQAHRALECVAQEGLLYYCARPHACLGGCVAHL
jgi:hypothetical protein